MKTVEFGDSSRLTGELTKGKIAVQSFTAKETKLSAISVNFGTYKRLNKGSLVYKIMDEKSITLFEEKFDVRNIKNDAFHELKTNVRLKLGNKYYLLVYSVDGPSNFSVSAKYGPSMDNNEKFILNGKPIGGALYCTFTYEKDITKEMNKQPKSNVEGLISVIIPTYNTAQYFKACLQSIQKQTYNNIEVIVVDDKSESADRSSIKRIIKSSPLNIQSIMKQKNGGAGAARNSGADKASGQFLFFCDSDIVLNKDCFAVMMQALHDNPDCEWAYCDYKIGDKPFVFKPFNADDFKIKNYSSTMSLIPSKSFPKFNSELKRLQDWDLFLRMIENGDKGIWINEFLFTTPERKGITSDSIPWEDAVAMLKKVHPDL